MGYVDVPVDKKTKLKVQKLLIELKSKGTKLWNGKPVETEDDVISYLLDNAGY